jgi:hypothetical protein
VFQILRSECASRQGVDEPKDEQCDDAELSVAADGAGARSEL